MMDVVFAATDGLKLSVLLNSAFNDSCQRRCSMSDKEKSSKTTDPQKKNRRKKNWGNSWQTASYWVRNKRQPACLSELLILFEVWAFFQWLDCNLTGVWLCGFLSCKNLSFIITNSDKPGDASLRLKEYYLPSPNEFSTFFQPYQRRTWRFTHRYVETSNMWKFRVFLRIRW